MMTAFTQVAPSSMSGLARNHAMVDGAFDHRALVDQAILDLGVLADVLWRAMSIFGINLVVALDGIKIRRGIA
jgi:hypothetical protein